MTMTSTPTDERLKQLLLWLRRERIVCTELTVGDVSLSLNDLGLAATLTSPSGEESDEDSRRNLYAQYGGQAIDEAAKQEEDLYEDD